MPFAFELNNVPDYFVNINKFEKQFIKLQSDQFSKNTVNSSVYSGCVRKEDNP